MGKKSGPRGKNGGKQGKGRSISKLKKTNIKHHKLAKKGKMKPPGSKPLFLQGGHMQEKKLASAAKKKTLNRLDMEEEAARRREYEAEKAQMEEEALDQMVDMIDPEDLSFLKQASKNNSDYEMLQNSNKNKNGGSKMTATNGECELDEYERKALQRQSGAKEFKRVEEQIEGKKRPLLPIRTKDGWQQRIGKAIDNNSDDELSTLSNDFHDQVSEMEEGSSDEEQVVPDSKFVNPISIIDIVARRRLIIQRAKLQIGSMASNFLEAPEERVQVLEKLVRMVSEDMSEINHLFKQEGENLQDEEIQDENDLMPAMHTIAKLAALSVCEILKDIIPNYKIIDASSGLEKDAKLKKDTIKLQKYENAILSSTKNYLIKLERIVANSRKNEKKSMYAGKQSIFLNSQRYAISCTSELLKSHPYFNFMSDNVVNFLVPFLNATDTALRKIVGNCVKNIFVTDKRGEVSYAIIKKINHHLKTKTHEKIQPDMLEVLLTIPLYSLNEANAQRENDLENKKGKKGKKAEPYISKKERKRLKASSKLEKELLEAKGEESTKTKLRFATDITNLLFAIYFRLLKTITDPKFLNKKGSQRTFRVLLNPLLSGLSKFGHLMSIEFFQDLLRTLISLLKSNSNRDKELNNDDQGKSWCTKPLLGNYEVLKCVESVFSILSGQGDQLTIDPSTFYGYLSRSISELNILDANQELENSNNQESVIDKNDIYTLACTVLKLAYVRRRKKVTRSSVTDIWKRAGIAALQSSGPGATKLLEFLRECGNTCPTLWSNYLQVDDDDEVGGECAVAGIMGSSAANHLGTLQGMPTTEDEKFVNNLNSYHLWELSMLRNHVETQVSFAVDSIFRTSVPTTVNASSSDTSWKNLPKISKVELVAPPKLEYLVNVLCDEEESETECSDDSDVVFAILNKDLPQMRTVLEKRRNRSSNRPNLKKA